MLLLSAIDAAQAIGAKCGGASVDLEDPGLVAILQNITTKVENVLNVSSLTRGTFRDRFELVEMPPRNGSRSAASPKLTLRLSNGFLAETESLVITDPAGDEVNDETYYGLVTDIDASFGLVSISSWTRGVYYVDYTAGFLPTDIPDPLPPGFDEDARVLQGIPPWMKLIAINYVVQWYRTNYLQPRIGKDFKKPEDLSIQLQRSILSAAYGRYQRPRAGCVWGDLR